MKYNPEIHHRRSIRLKGYAYSSDGMYCITICTQGREILFGEIIPPTVGEDLVSARMSLSNVGKMIETTYLETIDVYEGIISDKFIIMPNHLHCILRIDRADRADRVDRVVVDRADTRSAPTITIPAIIQGFKSRTTVEYIRGVKSGIYPPFDKRIWQRDYYEHIIRDEADYQNQWRYIDENPARWIEDEYYK